MSEKDECTRIVKLAGEIVTAEERLKSALATKWAGQQRATAGARFSEWMANYNVWWAELMDQARQTRNARISEIIKQAEQDGRGRLAVLFKQAGREAGAGSTSRRASGSRPDTSTQGFSIILEENS